MNKITVTGKTVQDAVQLGLKQLNMTEDRVKVTVIEQPSKGLFGLFGAKPATVELEPQINPLDQAVTFLDKVFKSMGLNITIEQIGHANHENGVMLNLSGPELGMIIGRRGQTLDALQYLANVVANRHSNKTVRFMLDAENFRERRRKTLEQLADRLAKRVLRTGKEVLLEPMSAQERKVIHSVLQHHPDVRTYSKGDEPNRRVVIDLK